MRYKDVKDSQEVKPKPKEIEEIIKDKQQESEVKVRPSKKLDSKIDEVEEESKDPFSKEEQKLDPNEGKPNPKKPVQKKVSFDN